MTLNQYTNYIKYLYSLRDEPITDEKIAEAFDTMLELEQENKAQIIDIEDKGFFIIGTKDNCHPGFDYYIINTYIKPEHRHQHIMQNTINDYIKNHPGSYMLCILNNNTPAFTFWKTIGTLSIMDDRYNDDEKCTQYVLSPYISERTQ